MIDGIMRKLGYINEKRLIDVAVEVCERNDEGRAKDQNGFIIAVVMRTPSITS